MRFVIGRLLTDMRSMLACQRGQVAIIFAFAVTLLFVAIGMGIDLWQAYSVKERLQSAVDAAALAIASTDRTQFTTAQLNTRVQSYVTSNYPAAALGTPGTPVLSYDPNNINIINVSDTASVPTTFMRVIGVNSLSVSTTGQAKAAWPNIDFYLLLDTSPSMGIAATQAGINLMVANTGPQGGCAFGCHEVNPSADGLGNPVMASSPTCNPPTGYPSGGEDNFALARCLGVTLRTDLLQTAVANLMTTASNTMATYTSTYRMAIYTFDVAFNTIQALTTDLVAAQAAAAKIQLLPVYDNNNQLNIVRATTGNTHTNTTLDNLASTTGVAVGQTVYGAGIAQGTTVTTKNSSTRVTLSTAATATAAGVPVTFATHTNNNDTDTNYDNAMTHITAILPNPPGHGTKSPGDTPKAILFFVTDGVEDEVVAGCATSPTVDCSGTRQESVMDPGWCNTIKNPPGQPAGSGPLIAILYTEYLPLPTNAWYNSHVSKYQTDIGTTLQSCATPGLYTSVTTDGDISAALAQLFLLAVNSVFLSK